MDIKALLAGLFTAKEHGLVSMDADLHDAPGVMAAMIKHYRDGKAIVYGVRSDRDSDTFFSRLTV